MKHWINAFRLRTLPLAVTGMVLGAALAKFAQPLPFILLILTAVLLQITSNLANDLGDFNKGADQQREGEARMVSSGKISPQKMKFAVILTAILGFISGVSSLYFAEASVAIKLTLLSLGLIGIWAAISYTMGKFAYGYRGLGDVFVLLFFGLVPIVGSATLLGNHLNFWHILPALSIGLLASSVLNANNLRDYHQDKINGKNTLVVRMGLKKAKIYHAFLIGLPFVFTSLYLVKMELLAWQSICFYLSLIPLFPSVKKVCTSDDPKIIDAQLKFHALGTAAFGFLLAFGISYV